MDVTQWMRRAESKVANLIMAAKRIRRFDPAKVHGANGRRYARRTAMLWIDAIEAIYQPDDHIPDWVMEYYSDCILAVPKILAIGGIYD